MREHRAIELPTAGPFQLEATVRVLQRRPTNPIDLFEQGRWRRLVDTGTKLVLVEAWNDGTIQRPRVLLRALAPPGARLSRAVVAKVVGLLGLDVDPAPLARVGEVIPSARPLLARLAGMRPPRYGDLFEALVCVVPFQQVSLEAGLAVLGRLARRFGRSFEHDGASLVGVPVPEFVAGARTADLRATGLSTTKAECLRIAAREIADGTLTFDAIATLPDSEATARLRELPGIGPWSAHLVLLRGFGRLDAFPPGDVGVARGLSRLTGRALGPADCAALGERIPGAGGWLYFLSLAAQLVERGLVDVAAPTS